MTKLKTGQIVTTTCILSCLAGVAIQQVVVSLGDVEQAYRDLDRQIRLCAGKFLCGIQLDLQGLVDDKVVCVDHSKLCNQVEDCPMGNDEVGCPPVCGDTEITCSDNENCGIPCDRNSECDDREDEKHCPPQCYCPAGYYRCKDMRTCVRRSQVCDRRVDCPNGDDEFQCSDTCTCSDGEFRCSDGLGCVKIAGVCDGTSDCRDKSDESSCRPGCFCDAGEYLCPNSTRCIPRSLICDGEDNDCENFNEEDLCIQTGVGG